MAKIKNVSGEDLIVPWLGHRLVIAGSVVEVPDDQVFAYTQQNAWEPSDAAAKKAHEAAVAAAVEAVEPDEPGGNDDDESEA